MKVQRHLAPTAAPISWREIARAFLGFWRGPQERADREAELSAYFGAKHVCLLSSGRAALATIVHGLAAGSSRRNVIIPAYTCYSVPSAIVRAGCRVVLCDVDPHTLDFDYSDLRRQVDGDTLCIVAPHLLGQAVDIPRVRTIAQAHHIPVVEDAAQAMGGRLDGRWLGMQGDVGFFSLGRGKNVTAGSGGIILTNSDEMASRLLAVYEEVTEASLMSQVMNVLMVAAMRLALHPRLYWLPAGFSFLGLGETIFDRDFALHKMDGMRAGLLAGWQERLRVSNTERVDRASQFLDQLPTSLQRFDPVRTKGVAYLRVPLLMPTADSKAAVCALARSQGLGVGSLYPAPISDIPELEGILVPRRCEGARTLAERLVTLPVHHYVERTDIERICRALQAITELPSASDIRREQVLSPGSSR
jgi:dTDP-4-amino-4,6-dideoxygalactose transaminase